MVNFSKKHPLTIPLLWWSSGVFRAIMSFSCKQSNKKMPCKLIYLKTNPYRLLVSGHGLLQCSWILRNGEEMSQVSVAENRPRNAIFGI